MTKTERAKIREWARQNLDKAGKYFLKVKKGEVIRADWLEDKTGDANVTFYYYPKIQRFNFLKIIGCLLLLSGCSNFETPEYIRSLMPVSETDELRTKVLVLEGKIAYLEELAEEAKNTAEDAQSEVDMLKIDVDHMDSRLGTIEIYGR